MSDAPHFRSPDLLSAAASRLVIIDVQQKFVPVIPGIDRVIRNCVKLLKAAQILNVPCDGAEQYPAGLGPTVPEIAEFLPERNGKMRFSAAQTFDWASQRSHQQQRHQVVIAGIETHVCVLQTAFDLMSQGFDVFLVVDAIDSRFPIDHEVALKRLIAAGARQVTTEMVLFEWCEIAGTDEFKQLSRIITGRQ